jgi:putative flavoprotein involved in K+ transport
MAMDARTAVAIIGGGQAGLAVSYHLKKRGVEHIVLEQGRVGETWRSKRWDSFTLVTPGSLILLPGFPEIGDDPHRFLSRDEFVSYLERYAASFDAPLRCGVRVTALERNPAGGFVMRLDNGALEAGVLVVATGGYHLPQKPAFGYALPTDVLQLNPEQYRNPQQIPAGAVLVVGSGQSGAQIAEELHQAGRKVFLSVGRAGRWPRRYRGRDINVWLMEMDQRTIDMMAEPKPRFDSNPHLTGKDGGREINLRQLGREGVTLLGRMCSVEGGDLHFGDDLEENLLKADNRVVNVKKEVDKFIRQRGLEVPEELSDSDIAPGEGTPPEPILKLGLRRNAINTVIWATGYRLDFSWIKLPVFDETGFPLHTRGVSVQEGLYFVGLPWLYRATSSGLIGIGEDAAYIADHIVAGEAKRSDELPRH